MEGEQPSPSPSPNPSALLRDISNFRTPKPSSQNPNFHSPFPHFFTASKQTPSSSSSSAFHRRPSVAPSSRSKAARRLKAFELEQSQSSRKAQIRKEKSLNSLARSLAAWLNFLSENPRFCGGDLTGLNGGDRLEETGIVLPNGKRDSRAGVEVGIDRAWRSPKRQRDCSWRAGSVADAEPSVSLSNFSSLKVSLKEVCSFEDLKQRMRAYLSSASSREVLSVMSQVAKNIDEGRLKMKAHCPIVTDVGMKEKATAVLMCYNPTWLRIGLYIIFGGDSLLPNGDVNSDQEVLFLKMVVEKQFFSHTALAKAYAYNKLVEGLYRPGYFEALGNVILKRFLLLVLILDRAKSLSSLPITYGIDGIDGGSPLLFVTQNNIKSSRQVIHDFLSSEVMHGEGNIVAHLVIVGYKVSYQQYPLLEYDFKVKDLFEDLQDGVRLCRAIQLLQRDASILTKIAVPSDTRKKNLTNCGIAMKYLRQAAVPLSDDDGMMIVAEDISNGDKELTLSMLWNMFVHLQLPLLINKSLLLEEISKVKGVDVGHSKCTSSLMEMLLEWIQAICQKYDIKVDNLSSLVDGKAMWCLIDYYFHKELHCSCSYKETQVTHCEESVLSSTNNTDAVHNFILSQKLTTILGKFPEVLQISDILEHNGPCNERSVIILLVFLSSQLIGRKNMDHLNIHKLLGCTYQSPKKKRLSLEKCIRSSERPVKQHGLDEYRSEDAVRRFKVIQAWWRDMAKQNHNYGVRQAPSLEQCHLIEKYSTDTQRERAAIVIQCHFRGAIERHNFRKTKAATFFLRTVIHAWLLVNQTGACYKFNTTIIGQLSFESQEHSDIFGRYFKLMVDRHNFVRLKKSVLHIQRAVRDWITRRHQRTSTFSLEVTALSDESNLFTAAIVIQSYIRGWIARSRYDHLLAQLMVDRHNFARLKKSVLHIQRAVRDWITRRHQRTSTFSLEVAAFSDESVLVKAAIVIQSYVRGWIARSRYDHMVAQLRKSEQMGEERNVRDLQIKAVEKIQIAWRKFTVQNSLIKQCFAATKIQSHWRGWLMRKQFLHQMKAIIKIQCAVRYLKCQRVLQHYRVATRSAIIIQSNVRGWVARRESSRERHLIVVIQNSLVKKCFAATKIQSHWRGWLMRKQFLHQRRAIIKIQCAVRYLKCQMVLQRYRVATRSAIIIQSNVRGWVARREAIRERHLIVVIQSHCRGWLTRRDFLYQKNAIVKIQCALRCLKCWRTFQCYRHAATEIQRFVRGQVARNRLLGASCLCLAIRRGYMDGISRDCMQSLELKVLLYSVLKLQRWWRRVLLLKFRTKSAIIIQSYIRRWIAMREAKRQKHRVVVIQSYWKGYLARKESRGPLLDLRVRVEKSALNVDNGMRLINRLVSALSELLSKRSVSSILHTCATLDMATQHSQKCCETLVSAGAIDKLLKLIRSVSRSIPDQEVLKHALSTLRNLARYSHLAEVLIGTPGSVETVLWEFLRNKEEGYFIASELLKKLCSTQKGFEAVHNLPSLLKRLHSLAEDLKRKAINEKRNARPLATKDSTERRLREAAELLNLMTNG